MDERRAYLCLAATPGLGGRRIRLLVDDLGRAAAALEPAAARHPQLGPARAVALRRIAASREPERLEARARRAGQRLLTPADAGYPPGLRDLADPPPRLFVRGALPALPAVAVVGTRDASSYGLALADELACDLARRGVAVVSGLALGIDARAHAGALRAPGATVAVLGGALDRPAPARHEGLAERIVAGGGALLSEHPPGTPARPGFFPARNRLVAALVGAVVVVEAGRRSGALITAGQGLELGRSVLAVPGRVGDRRAEGVLGLLRDGAPPATSADDVLAELGWAAAAASPPPPPGAPGGTAPGSFAPDAPAARVLASLRELGAASVEGLVEATGLGGAELLRCLVELELEGAAVRAGAGRYRAAGSDG